MFFTLSFAPELPILRTHLKFPLLSYLAINASLVLEVEVRLLTPAPGLKSHAPKKYPPTTTFPESSTATEMAASSKFPPNDFAQIKLPFGSILVINTSV